MSRSIALESTSSICKGEKLTDILFIVTLQGSEVAACLVRPDIGPKYCQS